MIKTIRKLLPWEAVFKGVFMTFLLIAFSEKSNVVIFIAPILYLMIRPGHSLNFYLFFSLFWPIMEMFIIWQSKGHAWIYKHPDIFGIPLYIMPLWAIVSDCVLDVYEWAATNDIFY